MAENSLPWGTAADDPDLIPPMYQERWRQLFGGALPDGVVHDYDGTGLEVTADGSSSITITAGEAVVQGVHYQLTADLVLNLDAVTAGPTSGQFRRDRIVLRYDPTAQTVTAKVLAGAINGALPTMAADPVGLWDFELAHFTRTATTGLSTVGVDTRDWSAGIVYRQTGHPDTAALGTVVVNADGTQYARVMVSGSPVWLAMPVEASWTAVTLAGGISNDSFVSLNYRRVGRWLLQIDGIVKHATFGSFFTAGAEVTVGNAPYDYGNVGADPGPMGGRQFPVVLEASGASGSMTEPLLSRARIRTDGLLTVWIPTGVSGCDRIQFSAQLKVY